MDRGLEAVPVFENWYISGTGTGTEKVIVMRNEEKEKLSEAEKSLRRRLHAQIEQDAIDNCWTDDTDDFDETEIYKMLYPIPAIKRRPTKMNP